MSGGTLCPSAECPGGHSARGDNPPSHTGCYDMAIVIKKLKKDSQKSVAAMATTAAIQFLYAPLRWYLDIRLKLSVHAYGIYLRRICTGILNTWIGNGSVIYVYRKTIRDAPTWILNW